MTQATGSASRILIAKESTFGTAPTTGWSKLSMATFGESLTQTAEALRSNRITGGNRGSAGFRNGLISANGAISVEFGTDGSDVLLEGLAGLKTGTGTALDPFIYKRGLTIPSFSIEKGHLDINNFFMFKGFKVDNLELNFEPGQYLSGNFGFLGKGDVSFSATSGAATFTTEPSIIFNGIDSNVSIDSVLKDNITSFTINIQNELKGQAVLGNKYANNRVNLGKGLTTGSLSMLFEDDEAFDDWLNEVEKNYLIYIEYSNKVVEIELPRVRYTGDGIVKISTADGLLYTLNWEAITDDTEASDFIIRQWTI